MKRSSSLVIHLVVLFLLLAGSSIERCLSLMGNNIESNLEICSSLYPSDENQFRLVNVTLIVRDSNGLPL